MSSTYRVAAFLVGLGGICLPSSSTSAAEHRTATVNWSGMESFEHATITDSMSATVRRPGTVGGVGIPAIFLHPQTTGRAVADFGKVEVSGRTPGRVFFLTRIGISDGMKWNEPGHEADGVRFYVSIEGKDAARRYLRANRWTPLVAPLFHTTSAGTWRVTKRLALATDSGPHANSNYDWALFGDPVVVTVPSAKLPAGRRVAGTNGVLIAHVTGGKGTLHVEGLDPRGVPVADAVASPSAEEGTSWTFVQFDFKSDAVTQWRWRAKGVEVDRAFGGSWQPQLVLESIGPVRAVSCVGEPLTVRVNVRNAGRGTLLPEMHASVACANQRLTLGRLPPGATKGLQFPLKPGRTPASVPVTARLRLHSHAEPIAEATATLEVLPRLPKLPVGRTGAAGVRRLNGGFFLLQNSSCRWLLYTNAAGLAGVVDAWTGDKWERVGSVSPWAEVVLPDGTSWLPRFAPPDVRTRSARFTGTHPNGWTCELTVEVGSSSPALLVRQRLTVSKPLKLLAFRGPAVCAGDRASATKKGVALFPGLEYLAGAERSSSDRDFTPPLNERTVPHKFKVTVPLMMVQTCKDGPVLGIVWKPTQKWDGEHECPAAAFASPNFLTHQNNHLMQLLLPSVPDFMPENRRQADTPLTLAPGKPWQLTQYLLAGQPRPDATEVLDWYARLLHFPPAEPWPRSFDQEMALCRHAFLKTVWDETAKQSLHYVGSGKANAPGFATLMLMDARAVARGADRQRLLNRVRLIAQQVEAQQGAAGLASRALCHIMGWEFPFHWGRLSGALAGMKRDAYAAVNSQEEDGGWGYNPNERQAKLGERGARVIGICARNAYLLAKWTALSGDPVAETALRKALAHMERYQVPRGAQGWECPIREPDVLASAYAVRAYVWAHMATGDRRWLEKARFWARTGLAFQYVWDDGKHPGMRYASIPVFGTTFFTHSWLGLPVQWCGLVYAYSLVELTRFDPNELWRKQIEGITASATLQQWPEDNKKLAGTYPDSFGRWFTRRNPVYINPEDIQVNVLALQGHDPGLRSVRTELPDGALHVTAPGDLAVTPRSGSVTVRVEYVPNEVFFLAVAPVAITRETTVVTATRLLSRQETLGRGQTGWTYNRKLGVLVVGLRAAADGSARLVLSRIRPSMPPRPVERTKWEFKHDPEGWSQGHSCLVTAAAGHLKIRVTGNDPYAVSGPTHIPAARFKKLRIRVRLTGGNDVGLFFRSSRSPDWGPDKEVRVSCKGDGQWRELVFDMSRHPLWAGSILQLRLDLEPSDVPVGSTLEVDWIRPQ